MLYINIISLEMNNSIIEENERVGELEAQNAFLRLRIRLYDKALRKLLIEREHDNIENENNNIINDNRKSIK